jgi:3-dehydroquinate dehydratase-1
MICVSIAERDFYRCKEALLESKFAELRIDQTDFTEGEIRKLFALPVDIIATCRPGTKSDKQRESLLLAAISSGAAYVDIELEADPGYHASLLETARKYDCKIIVSHHNAEFTPPNDELDNILDRCFERGADIAKLVCRVHSSVDCARILSLYQNTQNILAFGLGKKGAFTRVSSLYLGAPFTYAALSAGKETADGQPDRHHLERILDALR